MKEIALSLSDPKFLAWIESLPQSPLKEAIVSLQDNSAFFDRCSPSTKKKEQEHDILAIMPPPPTQFAIQSASLSDAIIDSFATQKSSSPREMNASQQATLLAAITTTSSWENSDKSKNLLQGVSSGSHFLNSILSQYASKTNIGGIDALSTQQTLQKTLTLSPLFYGVDREIAAKAYILAEQEITLNLLDKWAAMELMRAEKLRELMKKEEISSQEIFGQFLRDYTQDVENKRQTLCQPALSLLLGIMAIGASSILSLPLVPGIETLSLSMINSVIQTLGISSATLGPLMIELPIIIAGFLTAMTAWASPTAISFLQETKTENIRQASAHSFGITLATFLTHPGLEALLRSRIEKVSGYNTLLSKEYTDQLIASLKISLLIETVALLYKTEYGGITSSEIADLISMPRGENSISELISLYLKLIDEERSKLGTIETKKLIDTTLAQYDTQDYKASEALIEPIRIFLALIYPQGNLESHIARSEKA